MYQMNSVSVTRMTEKKVQQISTSTVVSVVKDFGKPSAAGKMLPYIIGMPLR